PILGGRPAPYAPVDQDSELPSAIKRVGAPGIVKTRREGYDGKGQWRIASAHEAESLRVPNDGLVYEGFVRFEAEFSVILVRGRDGEVRFWDSPQNVHESGILARSSLPAAEVIASQVDEARRLAQAVAEALNYVGVLTLEFFATSQGPVFNEMAPRVHNSGHWTIEGAVTSQFENHIRAICGLPLGDTATLSPRVEMRNLIGDTAEATVELITQPSATTKPYQKPVTLDGEDMAHSTEEIPWYAI